VSLAVVYFIWGVISQVIAQNEEERKNSRDKIIHGIVGMFVIVAVWGLVRFVGTTLGVEVSDRIRSRCLTFHSLSSVSCIVLW
jgi:hypothetical protein